MNGITRHPTEETLAAHAAGTLDEARELIVSMHLSHCNGCSGTVALGEHIGGMLIEAAAPAPLAPGALAETLLQLGGVETDWGDEAAIAASPLSQYELGPWRWVGPGVYRRRVSVPQRDEIRVFMLRAAPGTKLPHHKHTGFEWTCVLQGAFEHEHGRYGPGDFDEADETMEHRPVVAEGDPCICIVALEGNIELQSRLGKLLQPLIRI